ncbi:MAG: glutamate-5-semialdehyde dehydrogenase [Limisphaerales bacterium]|nr:glutamate-5-semialdehyde dehydrogenase [Verrucomicrobiota bacterium]
MLQNMDSLKEQMEELGRRAKDASRALALLSTDNKNRCLIAMSDAILAAEKEILEANCLDVENGKKMGLSSALLDRLTLTPARISAMADGVKEVAALPDPVGRELDFRVCPNGLELQKITTPIGVIVIIFESRPNVTADAASLCFKSGNATILRGGKEAAASNRIISKIMVSAAQAACKEFPEYAIQVVNTTDRQAVPELLSLTECVDLCIPRGGEGLIRAVVECSRVPIIKHYKGVCHVYLHENADFQMANRIVLNAKTQRPGVCNAAESLLVDESIASDILPFVARSLLEKKVKLYCDPKAESILKRALPQELTSEYIFSIQETSWDHEYLDLSLSVGVVQDLNAAIGHINRYGSGHSESIVTNSEEAAAGFQKAVDAAAVYWNASTRFTDGAEFGMGAEIGISTDKIGARGPMGLEELTAYKWLVCGKGQIRE